MTNKFSSSTLSFVDNLFSKSNVPSSMRTSLKKSLQTGEPAPSRPRRLPPTDPPLFGRPSLRYMTKRTKDCISIPPRDEAPPAPGMDRQKLTLNLQNKMEGVKMNETRTNFCVEKTINEEVDLFTEIENEIQERFEFLVSLDKKGLYENEEIIKLQIVSKLNELKSLNFDKYVKLPKKWFSFVRS
ncbi:hypothetical protein P9112_003963 [Eukaryota sp. TZLM1-RC]